MKQLFLLLGLLLVFPFCSIAQQKVLQVEDVTKDLSVYPCNDRHEALVVVHCAEDFDLNFETNVDKDLNITVDDIGNEKRYNIVFVTQEAGTSYSNRKLNIYAKGFEVTTYPLSLSDKQKLELRVSDPYSKFKSPFYTYQEKGNEEFKMGSYGEAQVSYQLCATCPEYESFKTVIDEKIAICDSIRQWTSQGARAAKLFHYNEAADAYMKVMLQNPNDESIKSLISDYRQKSRSNCEANLQLATKYMDDKSYEKAKRYYQKMIDEQCAGSGDAVNSINVIEEIQRNKENRAHCFFVEGGQVSETGAQSVGISFVTCGTKTKGFFTLRASLGVPDLIQKQEMDVAQLYHHDNLNYKGEDLTSDKFASVAFGWNIPVVKKYAWLFFGPGYTCGAMYGPDENHTLDLSNLKKENGEYTWNGGDRDKLSDYSKLNLYHAVSPEAGIILKYKFIALKYTFQYRYFIGDDFEMYYTGYSSEPAYTRALADMFGTQQHCIAIGFCW